MSLSHNIYVQNAELLRETSIEIDITSVVDEYCPNCGASLAETLTTKRNQLPLQQQEHQQPTTIESKLPSVPEIQTAYDLMKFSMIFPTYIHLSHLQLQAYFA